MKKETHGLEDYDALDDISHSTVFSDSVIIIILLFLFGEYRKIRPFGLYLQLLSFYIWGNHL